MELLYDPPIPFFVLSKKKDKTGFSRFIHEFTTDIQKTKIYKQSKSPLSK